MNSSEASVKPNPAKAGTKVEEFEMSDFEYFSFPFEKLLTDYYIVLFHKW
jgi:hypothetical protein